MQIVTVEIVPVLVATVVNFLVSGVLHGVFFKKVPVGVGKAPKMDAKTFGISVAATFLMMYVFAHVLAFAEAMNFVEGMQGGFWMWLGFIMPMQIATKLINGQKWQTFFANTFCVLVALLITGGIIAAW